MRAQGAQAGLQRPKQGCHRQGLPSSPTDTREWPEKGWCEEGSETKGLFTTVSEKAGGKARSGLAVGEEFWDKENRKSHQLPRTSPPRETPKWWQSLVGALRARDPCGWALPETPPALQHPANSDLELQVARSSHGKVGIQIQLPTFETPSLPPSPHMLTFLKATSHRPGGRRGLMSSPPSPTFDIFLPTRIALHNCSTIFTKLLHQKITRKYKHIIRFQVLS